jgi:Delta3-Delta2-enoyl-CoA isomerase
MPTIALINGHVFAGGLVTAMAHDYRTMNPHKSFLCLNELEFGAGLRPAMASLFRVKLSMHSHFVGPE